MTESRSLYEVAEISGAHYRELLEIAQLHCRQFLCVVRPSLDLSEQAAAFLARCQPYLLLKTARSEWPGTQLLEDVATIYTFELGDYTASLLREAADGLQSWLQPDLPEDLCLLRANGTPWLVSITHEGDYYFELSAAERSSLQGHLPWLVLETALDGA